MARPAKELDELSERKIVQVIERGGTRSCAAEAAGIAPRTLYRWLARGRSGDEEFRQFWQRIRRCEAVAEMEMVDSLFTAAKTDPRFSIEWLGRRRPKTWAKRDLIKAQAAVPADLAHRSEEELQARMVELTADAMEHGDIAQRVATELQRRKEIA